jgi:hypothetical protein
MPIRHYLKLNELQQDELKGLFNRLRKTPGGELMAQVWKDGAVVSLIDARMVDAIQAVTGQTGTSRSALENFNHPAAPNIAKAFAEEDHTQ